MKSKKGIIVLSIISLIILFIGINFCTNKESEIRGFIKVISSGERIDFSNYPKDFYGLDKTLDNYDVYLTGEAHGVKMCYDLEKYMSKYFVENKGVRYILIEAGYSVGEFLNKYLETGDENIPRYLVSQFRGTFSYTQDSMDMYRFYYNLNKKLDNSKKIKFIGVDTEHQSIIAIDYLKSIIEKKIIPKSIEPFINKIKKSVLYYKFTDEEAKYYIEKYEDDFKKCLGDDYFSFKLMMRNIFSATAIEYSREKNMIQNFIECYNHFPKGKYYGQFGEYHTRKVIANKLNNQEGNIKTIAYYLHNEFNKTKGKVYSINYIYNKGKYRNPYKGEGNIEELDAPKINIPFMKGKTAKIYNPNIDRDVYKILNELGFEDVTKDSFILINKSPAAKEYIGK